MESTNVELICALNLHEDAAELVRVNDLPLGIPNEEQHPRTHIIQSDATLWKKAWRRGQPPKNPGEVMLYANFSNRNYSPERTSAWDAMRDVPGACALEFQLSKQGRLRNLIATRQSDSFCALRMGDGYELFLRGTHGRSTSRHHSFRSFSSG